MSIRLLLIALLLLSASASHAQELSQVPVSISFENVSLYEALPRLNALDGVKLSYNPDALSGDRMLDHTFTNAPVGEVLSDILGEDYELKYRGSYIIIQRSNQTGKKSKFSLAGGIQDAETGETLKNVTVYDVNSLDATLSDDQGDFELSVSSKSDYVTVAISRENYQDTIVQVSTSQKLEIPIQLQRVETIENEDLNIREEFYKVVNFFTTQISRINVRNVDMEEEQMFQASFVPMIGTNGKLSGKVRNRISLNLIAGYGRGLDGIELGGVYNIIRKDVEGIQLSGFGNATGGRTNGVQLAGFVNTNAGYTEGVQGAGFVNIVTHDVKGAQMAGFLNISHRADGAQLAGFTNISIKQVVGFQGAGFTNFAQDMEGVQASGFLNLARDFEGTQAAGFYNQGRAVKGTQVSGFFNIAKSLNGVQVGIVNVVDSLEKGAVIGIFNFVRNGKIEFGLENNEISEGAFTFRSGTNGLYAILSSGYNSGHDLWVMGAGFGSQIGIGNKFFLNLEMTSNSLLKEGRKNDELNILNRFNLNFGYKLSEKWSINAGPAFNYYLTHQINEETGELGDEIYQTTFFDQIKGDIRTILFPGYAFSLRFEPF